MMSCKKAINFVSLIFASSSLIVLLWGEIEFVNVPITAGTQSKWDEAEETNKNETRISTASTPALRIPPPPPPPLVEDGNLPHNVTNNALIGVVVSSSPTTPPTERFDKCRHGQPWLEYCAEYYNKGNWTIRSSPLVWNQTYSIEDRLWHMAARHSPSECQQIGTSLEWQSHADHHHRSADGGWNSQQFLDAVGPNQVITFVGDSLTRQHFATLLEALDHDHHILSCTGQNHGWGKRFPRSCVTTKNVTIQCIYDNFGSWDDGIPAWDGGIRGKSYIGTMATQDYFRDSHLIIMNFGLWYYEQGEIGIQTNHTKNSYERHVRRLVNEVAMYRQSHQLVVWRETTLAGQTKHPDWPFRSLFAQHQIPVIYDHSVKQPPSGRHLNNKKASSSWTAADLYMDAAHFCEPAIQMAWNTILSHMVQDWRRNNSAATTVHEKSATIV
jgi:hypothetical protein